MASRPHRRAIAPAASSHRRGQGAGARPHGKRSQPAQCALPSELMPPPASGVADDAAPRRDVVHVVGVARARAGSWTISSVVRPSPIAGEGVGDRSRAGLVEVGGRLVEHRAAARRAGRRGRGRSAGLAGRQPPPALADRRCEPVRQRSRRTRRRRPRSAPRATSPPVAPVGTEQHVLGDRAGEQLRALRHPGDLLAPAAQVRSRAGRRRRS